MQKHLIAAAVTLTLALAAGTTYAADNGIYLGGSIGQSGVEFDESLEGENFSFDDSATGFKVIAGWRFLDWLAVEGNYVDLGSVDDTIDNVKFEADVSGVSLSAVGFLPVGPVDLFARVGAITWDADVDVPSLDLSASDDGTDLTYGVGAQFRVWSLSLRGEYEVFDIDGSENIDMFSVGVTWTFL